MVNCTRQGSASICPSCAKRQSVLIMAPVTLCISRHADSCDDYLTAADLMQRCNMSSCLKLPSQGWAQLTVGHNMPALLNPQGVTRIKYLTDGVLIREMMEDPLLTRYRYGRPPGCVSGQGGCLPLQSRQRVLNINPVTISWHTRQISCLTHRALQPSNPYSQLLRPRSRQPTLIPHLPRECCAASLWWMRPMSAASPPTCCWAC